MRRLGPLLLLFWLAAASALPSQAEEASAEGAESSPAPLALAPAEQLARDCRSCHARQTGGEDWMPRDWRSGDADLSKLYWSLVRGHPPLSEQTKTASPALPAARFLSELRTWLENGRDDDGDTTRTLGSPQLRVKTSRQTYRPGEPIDFAVLSARACTLTVIMVDTEGLATVMWPNAYRQKVEMAAGQEVRLPSPEARFQIKASATGSEKVLAFCSTDDRRLFDIKHDFIHDRFTPLGKWAPFLEAWAAAGRPEPTEAEIAAARKRFSTIYQWRRVRSGGRVRRIRVRRRVPVAEAQPVPPPAKATAAEATASQPTAPEVTIAGAKYVVARE